MKRLWLVPPLLTGLIVFAALQFVPASIKGNRHALVAGAIAAVASLIARKLSNF